MKKSEINLTELKQDLSHQSRVWVYMADRRLSDMEAVQLKEMMQTFSRAWVSHNQKLKSGSDLLFNQFAVLMADESQAGASGCSIDSSVRFMQSAGEEFGIDFFNRMLFAYLDDNGEVNTVNSTEFAELYQRGVIDQDTFVFDNLVDNLEKLRNDWVKPLNSSWHKRFV